MASGHAARHYLSSDREVVTPMSSHTQRSDTETVNEAM